MTHLGSCAGLDFLEHLVEGHEQRAQHLEVMAAEGIYAALVRADLICSWVQKHEHQHEHGQNLGAGPEKHRTCKADGNCYQLS